MVDLRIGKSNNGVYCASVSEYQLRIWLLRDSGGKMDWMLMHHTNLYALTTNDLWMRDRYGPNKIMNGPWVWTCYDHWRERPEKMEWDSDDDNH
ncbi:hypothetical protein EJB05_57797, partial [Eragrostis curvula]